MQSLRAIAPVVVSGTSSASGAKGRLEGSAALEWIRGFYSEDRSVFADRVLDRLKGIEEHVAADRPHILIKGAPLKDASLHRLVEEAGGYVVAEDDWRGSRAAGDTRCLREQGSGDCDF